MVFQEVLQRRQVPWRWGVRWLAIRSWQQQLTAIIEADPLTTGEVAEELNINCFTVVQNLKQIGKVKKRDKWVPRELTENFKNRRLLLFYATIMSHLLIGLWCVTKSGFYMTTGNDQFSSWTGETLQSTSQSQACTKKRSWPLYGDLLPVRSTTAFWIPAKSLHLRNMLSKWWDVWKTAMPAASIV